MRASAKQLQTMKMAASEAADLEITPFMNLMIVLVPILLLSMVFVHMRVLHIQLPELQERLSSQDLNEDLLKQLELVITPSQLTLNYPSGVPLKHFQTHGNGPLPTQDLRDYLQTVKATFQAQHIDKTDITLLPTEEITYQQLISIMDTVRAYPTVVATSVVQAELFPNISFGDAPPQLSSSESS